MSSSHDQVYAKSFSYIILVDDLKIINIVDIQSNRNLANTVHICEQSVCLYIP